MCESLSLSRSGYYSWLKRKQSQRKREDGALKKRIEAKSLFMILREEV